MNLICGCIPGFKACPEAERLWEAVADAHSAWTTSSRAVDRELRRRHPRPANLDRLRANQSRLEREYRGASIRHEDHLAGPAVPVKQLAL